MKKWLMLLLLLLCVTLPAMANADAKSDWEQSCRQKTRADAVLYDWIDDETLAERGNLPEGTYIKVYEYDENLQVWHVEWFQDGMVEEGWLRHGDIAPARVNIHFTDGTGIFVNEALADDMDALKAYLEENYPDKKLNGDGRQSAYKNGKRVTPVPTATPEPTATPTPSPSPTPEPTPEPMLADLAGKRVQVIEVGAYTCLVASEEGPEEVRTAELTFAEGVLAQTRVAVIHAPRSGECSLRAEASTRAKVLMKADAGVLVPVLEVGKELSLVRYKETVGYVQNNCLVFLDAAEAPTGKGVIILNGKEPGEADVTIRNAPGRNNAKVAEWLTGTEVTVFGEEKGWYAVEAQGVRGYVQEAYLELVKPEPTATPVPTATPEPTATPAPAATPELTEMPPLDEGVDVVADMEEAEPIGDAE